MISDDDTERLALAQSLMVEITVRLEELAERAAGLQLSRTSDPRFSEDILAVNDLLNAHGRLALPVAKRTRSKPPHSGL